MNEFHLPQEPAISVETIFGMAVKAIGVELAWKMWHVNGTQIST